MASDPLYLNMQLSSYMHHSRVMTSVSESTRTSRPSLAWRAAWGMGGGGVQGAGRGFEAVGHRHRGGVQQALTGLEGRLGGGGGGRQGGRVQAGPHWP